MTDEQIINALREVAKKYEGKPVATFETNISNMATDAADHIERLCDEINRQKAEIERFADIGKMYSEVRAEAVREFAEKLLDKYDIWSESDVTEYQYVAELVNNLVKEMTEYK